MYDVQKELNRLLHGLIQCIEEGIAEYSRRCSGRSVMDRVPSR